MRYPLKRVFTCSTLRTAELAWKAWKACFFTMKTEYLFETEVNKFEEWNSKKNRNERNEEVLTVP